MYAAIFATKNDLKAVNGDLVLSDLFGSHGTDGEPKRVLACSGYWRLVESHDGHRQC